MQRLKCFYICACFAVCLLAMPTHLLGQNVDCDNQVMKGDINPFPGVDSGLSGTARLCLGDEGAGGRLQVVGTKAGHAYTVWFFYIEQNGSVVGRLDSTVAEGSATAFAGRVGGLVAANGSVICFVVVDHGDVSAMTPLMRATNLLTPKMPFSALVTFNIQQP